MGIPLCLFAYGSLGMGVAAAISSLVVLLHFTANIFLASRKFDINIILKSPSTYAVIFAVMFLYYDLAMPNFISHTVMLLGYGMIVMILMSLGVFNSNESFSLKSSIITSLGRVVCGPIIGFIHSYLICLLCWRSSNSIFNVRQF